jgi:hypothetical protein
MRHSFPSTSIFITAIGSAILRSSRVAAWSSSSHRWSVFSRPEQTSANFALGTRTPSVGFPGGLQTQKLTGAFEGSASGTLYKFSRCVQSRLSALHQSRLALSGSAYIATTLRPMERAALVIAPTFAPMSTRIPSREILSCRWIIRNMSGSKDPVL